MHEITVQIQNKIASYIGTEAIVCNNSDYVVKFDFDAEWGEYSVKTAKFILSSDEFIPVVFEGDTCPVPVLTKTKSVKIGVEAGSIRTSTSAIVPCRLSATCDAGGEIPPPSPDVYSQIMKMMNSQENVQSLREDLEETKADLATVASDVVNLAETKADKTDVQDLERKVMLLESAAEGNIFNFETITDGTIPDNALKYAQIESVVGKSYIRSRNLLPFYPSHKDKIGVETRYNNVTRTVKADGSIVFNGTASGDISTFFLLIADNFSPAEGGHFFLSGCPAGGSEDTYSLRVNVHNPNGYAFMKLIDTGKGVYEYIDKDAFSFMTLYIQIKAGTVCDNLVFKPQLEHNVIATESESYTLKASKPVGLRIAHKNLCRQFHNLVVSSSLDVCSFGNKIFCHSEDVIPNNHVLTCNGYFLDGTFVSGEPRTIFVKLNSESNAPKTRFHVRTTETSSIVFTLTPNTLVRCGSWNVVPFGFKVDFTGDGSTSVNASCEIVVVKGKVSLDEFLAGYAVVDFPQEVIADPEYGIGDGENNKFYLPELRKRVQFSPRSLDEEVSDMDGESVYMKDNQKMIVEFIEPNDCKYRDTAYSFDGIIELPTDADCEIQLIPQDENTPVENMECAITYQVKVVN